jgi:hypothetical protein
MGTGLHRGNRVPRSRRHSSDAGFRAARPEPEHPNRLVGLLGWWTDHGVDRRNGKWLRTGAETRRGGRGFTCRRSGIDVPVSQRIFFAGLVIIAAAALRRIDPEWIG